jgi:hypothetical protein
VRRPKLDGGAAAVEDEAPNGLSLWSDAL